MSKVKGHQVQFLTVPVQEKPRNLIKMSNQQIMLLTRERIDLLEGSIQKTGKGQEEFRSNLFLEGEKDRRNLPMIKLKKLSIFMPFDHFKMKDLYYLKLYLQQNDYTYAI